MSCIRLENRTLQTPLYVFNTIFPRGSWNRSVHLLANNFCLFGAKPSKQCLKLHINKVNATVNLMFLRPSNETVRLNQKWKIQYGGPKTGSSISHLENKVVTPF